jgi:hypothetical protein
MQLGAHAVTATRLYAVSRVSGVVGIIWAIAVGVFILFGGAGRLIHPIYSQLIAFAGTYQAVGFFILTAGLIGLYGLASDVRLFSLTSTVMCMVWCAMVGGFLMVGNFGANGNLLSLFALHSTTVYILRFWLLVVTPRPGEAVRLR